MMVAPINQDDLSGSVMQGFGYCQTAETPADDDDFWLWHTFPDSCQIAATDARI
jgi:hypothetical protein